MPVFFRSIRTKTAVLFFLIFLGVILPVHWLVYKKIETALTETNERELKAEAEKLLSQVRLDPLTVPIPAEGFLLRLQVEQPWQWEEIFSSPGFPALQQFEYLQETVYADTLEILTVRKPLEQPETALLLSLARSNLVFQQQIASVQFYLFAAIALAVSLAGVLVFLASGWILKPIKEIAKAAVQIKTSKDDIEIPVPTTHDESRQLAESINAMLLRIYQSAKAQTNFFASAAHELRTPLAIMKAELTMANNETSVERIPFLLREVERLERVIHDFLLISELKTDTLVIRKKTEFLEELIYASLKRVKVTTEAYNTTVQLTMDEDAAGYSAQADADKLETVITNLVENAIKYSPRNSVIELQLTQVEGGTSIIVSNPVLAAVKNPELLVQEFKKSTELSSGLGMGLWICDQMVKRHGCSLTLSSTESQFRAALIIPTTKIFSPKASAKSVGQ
jgi:two-component system, OmpR family, heavy metal sensor histidine kinase CusS